MLMKFKWQDYPWNFDPYLTPGDKMKILKPFWASTRHAQWDPRVSFLKSLKCRRSSDKLFFLTDGRTERGNNNIPELSLESAGIIIWYKKNVALNVFSWNIKLNGKLFLYNRKIKTIHVFQNTGYVSTNPSHWLKLSFPRQIYTINHWYWSSISLDE